MPDVYKAQPEQPVEAVNEGTKVTEKKKFRKGGIFSTYIEKPDWVTFDTEDPRETVFLLVRRHWVTNVPWVVAAIIMTLAPSLLPFFPTLFNLPVRFELIIIAFWYLVTVAFIFEKFLSWFYDIYIVSSERIIDIDFDNLVFRTISQATLDRIESITVAQGGIVQDLFNYGNVLIQTAAEIENIIFEDVSNPTAVVTLINALQPDLKRNPTNKEGETDA